MTERLRSFVLGWKAYFRLAQTPDVWRTLDEWIRHRLRAIQLKQWGRARTIFRELTALGAKPDGRRTASRAMAAVGGTTAGCPQRRPHDPMGGPDGAAQTRMTSISRTARCGPACRVVWQGSDRYGRPLCRFPIAKQTGSMRERAAPVQCNVAAGAAELGGENEINSRDQFTLTAKDKRMSLGHFWRLPRE